MKIIIPLPAARLCILTIQILLYAFYISGTVALNCTSPPSGGMEMEITDDSGQILTGVQHINETIVM